MKIHIETSLTEIQSHMTHPQKLLQPSITYVQHHALISVMYIRVYMDNSYKNLIQPEIVSGQHYVKPRKETGTLAVRATVSTVAGALMEHHLFSPHCTLAASTACRTANNALHSGFHHVLVPRLVALYMNTIP